MDIGQYRDALPEAVELKHQALQTGLRYNPKSNILRKALGKKSVEQEMEENGIIATFVDSGTGLKIPVPEGWQRSKEAIDGDVTWIDPNSDTAYISLTTIPGTKADGFAGVFEKQLANYQSKQGYTEGNSEALGIAGASKEARFGFKEGREDRKGILSCILFIKQETAYVVYASYLEEELKTVDAAYKQILKAFEDHNEDAAQQTDTPKEENKAPTETAENPFGEPEAPPEGIEAPSTDGEELEEGNEER